jgi:BirA family biotin operon repressor/biotin-[acetyl-CoA-carboxylase] ligase
MNGDAPDPALQHGPPAARPAAAGTDSFGAFAEESILGWTLRRYGAIASTQDAADGLPPWTAVAAESQTAGRGQWQRTFTSDRGGFYLTAVLPFDGDALRWSGFALAVGWSIAWRFQARGIASVRLRWPNDLMIGDRKLGGILVDQGGAGTLRVGLGLNVANRPWLHDPGLHATACRLADFAREEQLGFEALLPPVLGALRSAHFGFSHGGLAAFAEALNLSWGEAREVRLEMAKGAPSPEVSGLFHGILPNGDLILEDRAGQRFEVRSHLVMRLHEV